MRRVRNRILLSGLAALLSAAVVAGPAAASETSGSDYYKPLPCTVKCWPVYQGHDLLDLDVFLKLCIQLGGLIRI